MKPKRKKPKLVTFNMPTLVRFHSNEWLWPVEQKSMDVQPVRRKWLKRPLKQFCAKFRKLLK
jgi:hypothetical protein